jgi:23S rRNA pseudouridine1911/1915/1917 synthase
MSTTPILILDQGKHHLVVYKLSNMVVVTGRGAPKPTLLDVMQEQFGKGIKPVHRLDRVTTGCCILAKTPYGQQALSDAFRKHLVDKRYLAIIEGIPDFKQINIDARLKRIDTPNNKKSLAHQVIADDGQRALTRVKVISTKNNLTLIEANPETGRMHQIRAHLSHLGFPVVGDAQYGSKTAYYPNAIALHAHKITFPLPEGGGRKTVTAEPELRFKGLI